MQCSVRFAEERGYQCEKIKSACKCPSPSHCFPPIRLTEQASSLKTLASPRRVCDEQLQVQAQRSLSTGSALRCAVQTTRPCATWSSAAELRNSPVGVKQRCRHEMRHASHVQLARHGRDSGWLARVDALVSSMALVQEHTTPTQCSNTVTGRTRCQVSQPGSRRCQCEAALAREWPKRGNNTWQTRATRNDIGHQHDWTTC
jgi:hypothetical protein